MAMDHPPEVTSAWSPLGQPVFRALWIAALFSNIGSWSQSVGATWLMVSLSAGSPLMIALLQSAISLPVFLLALPAGMLADLCDRRRLLLMTQGGMLAAAAGLGTLTILGVINPTLLLALIFFLGISSALNGPAWLAIDYELVPAEELPKAIAIDSAGFNLSRAVGPALGGVIVAVAGPGATFLLNAVSFLGVMAVLYRWRRPPSPPPDEGMVSATWMGLRLTRQAPALKAVLIRLGSFLVCSSALWALLPSVWYRLGGSPAGYGAALGCLGAGAVAGAGILAQVRARVALELVLAGATILFAAAMLILALVTNKALLGVAMFLAGIAWLALVSSLNAAVQTSVPARLRGRALAMYMLVFGGSLSAGCAWWGMVGEYRGLSQALAYAAGGLLLGLLAALRYRIE